MIATRHDIDTIGDADNELEGLVDTCVLNCWFCIVLDTSMTT